MTKFSVTSISAYDPVQDSHWLYGRGINKYIDGTVNATYWACKIGLWPIRRSRRIDLAASDVHKGNRYVIAANHQSVVDPFLITSQIPFSSWRRLVNLRYFLANYIFDKKALRPMALSLGCFPAKAHSEYPYGLDFALRQLRGGRSILIFPEGRRTIRGETPVRHGVQVLAREPDTLIIPVHIEWRREKLKRSFAFGIGKPFDGSNLSADEIMSRVYETPVE